MPNGIALGNGNDDISCPVDKLSVATVSDDLALTIVDG
jgi:hypothetical protein